MYNLDAASVFLPLLVLSERDGFIQLPETATESSAANWFTINHALWLTRVCCFDNGMTPPKVPVSVLFYQCIVRISTPKV